MTGWRRGGRRHASCSVGEIVEDGLCEVGDCHRIHIGVGENADCDFLFAKGASCDAEFTSRSTCLQADSVAIRVVQTK